MQEWKDIIGYKGIYQVNVLGEIKSFKYGRETILKNWSDKNGYLHTTLCILGKRKNFKIHRLIGIHFMDNPENKPEINHKNGIPFDNRLENIEWVTAKENIRHAFRTGLSNNNHYIINHPLRGKFGKDHHSSRKISQFTIDGEFIKNWDGATCVKRELGIDPSNIGRVCMGKWKSAGGFIWKYT